MMFPFSCFAISFRWSKPREGNWRASAECLAQYGSDWGVYIQKWFNSQPHYLGMLVWLLRNWILLVFVELLYLHLTSWKHTDFFIFLSFAQPAVLFLISFFAPVFQTLARGFTLSYHIFSFLSCIVPSVSLCLTDSRHPLCPCLMPSMHCIPPVVSPPSLGGCPRCHSHGQQSLSGSAHRSNTCHSQEIMWGFSVTKCVFVCERFSTEHWLIVHSRHVSRLLLHVSLCRLTCLSLTSPSLSVAVSLLYSVGQTCSRTRGLESDLGCLSSILRSPEGEAC